MLPNFSYKKNPLYNFKFNKKKYSILKNFILYIVYYIYPRSLVFFVEPIFKIFKVKKLKFVRSDCDHFGSWIFLLLCLHKLSDQNYLFVCFAKRDTIDKSLLSYFSEFNLKIIYNPYLQIILSPLFFTKSNAIDVNGHFPLSYLNNNKSYRKFESIGQIDSDFLKKINLKNKYIPSKKSFYEDDQEFIIFYPRLGDWEHSIGNSRRNMSLNLAKNLLKIISKLFKVILIGNTSKYFINDFNNLYSFESLVNNGVEIHDIYSSAKCIIGSISGATHFPSLLYNIPTLYIGDIPLDHILAIYNMINLQSSNIFSIPNKDKWIILNFENQDYITPCFWGKVLKEFLLNYKLEKNLDLDSYILESKLCRDNSSKPYNLKSSENGNLYLHKSYLTK